MNKCRKPPSFLTPAAKRWFCRITEQYVFETEGEWTLLEPSAAVLDRITECRKRIAAEGLTVTTAGGGCKPHPCLSAERDNRILLARLCRELRLAAPSADENRIPRLPR